MAGFLDILKYLIAPGAAAASTQKGRDFLFGQGREEVPTMTPEMRKFYDQLVADLSEGGEMGGGRSQALQNLRDLMDPSGEAFEKFAAPYLQEYEQQTIPNLAEKFAGAGAMGGGLSSSGFGQSLGAAGANLQTQLAALKAGLQQQAGQDVLGHYQSMTGQAMGAQPFGYQKPQQGFAQSALGSYAQAGFPGFPGL